jgi:glycogen(starch) synthase
LKGEQANANVWVALLGIRSTPTDGVEDYCVFLAEALARRNITLSPVRVEWRREGWDTALQSLAPRAEEWRGKWVFLQYTALAWSRRGFPFGALKVLKLLRDHGARVGVVFHEPWHQEARFSPARPVRSACQDYVVRQLHKRADLAIFTLPASRISWLRESDPKAVFIPIGANISEPGTVRQFERIERDRKTISVFCFSTGSNRQHEIDDIVHCTRMAAKGVGRIRLQILGKGSKEIREEIKTAIADASVEVTASGVVPEQQIAAALSDSDALLFVSGQVSQNRGSALAGVACGLPIVGYAGLAEGTPIAKAGLRLAPYRDRAALARAMGEVISDGSLWKDLHQRSLDAQREFFSWDSIAGLYEDACSRRARSAQNPATIEDSSQRLKLVIYSTYFLPSIGGVQTYVRLLAEGLSQGRFAGDGLGIDLTLISNTPSSEEYDRSFSYRIVRQPGFGALKRLIVQADVVFLAGPSLLPMLIAWMKRIPFAIEQHGYQAICPNGLLFLQPDKSPCPGYFSMGRYGKCLTCRSVEVGGLKAITSLLLTFPRRWLCDRAAANIAVTDHVRRRLNLCNSCAVYHGVPESEALAQLGNESLQETFSVGYLGRLVAEKGLPLLLRAARQLKDEGLNFRLVLVGDGPERQSLTVLATELEIEDRMTITGYLQNEELRATVANLSVMIMPSIWEETAGFSAIEYMMRGGSVIAADIGGLSEVVGDAGLTFPANDWRKLAECIRELARDPERRETLGVRARQRALEKFSVERMVREHAKILEVAANRA